MNKETKELIIKNIKEQWDRDHGFGKQVIEVAGLKAVIRLLMDEQGDHGDMFGGLASADGNDHVDLQNGRIYPADYERKESPEWDWGYLADDDYEVHVINLKEGEADTVNGLSKVETKEIAALIADDEAALINFYDEPELDFMLQKYEEVKGEIKAYLKQYNTSGDKFIAQTDIRRVYNRNVIWANVYTIPQDMTPDAYSSLEEYIKAVVANYERLMSYGQEWGYVDLRVGLSVNGVEVGTSSLGGIEYDFGGDNEYLLEVLGDNLHEALSGFSEVSERIEETLEVIHSLEELHVLPDFLDAMEAAGIGFTLPTVGDEALHVDDDDLSWCPQSEENMKRIQEIIDNGEEERIWTVKDFDCYNEVLERGMIVERGKAYVDRQYYIVTDKPYEGEEIEFWV